MTVRVHQQYPHNHRVQRFNRPHLHHSPFRLCQVRIISLICILTLICFLFPVLYQVGIHGLVHLFFRLLRLNRRYVGHHRQDDRTRHLRGAYLITNPHRLIRFKHLHR
ncbi:hypothetical protein Goshw_013890, partial [Gossypium schwendimanii]|nr:hypothetical protein [Gossypium schwendimanii]